MSLKTVAHNLRTHLGKDSVIRLIVSIAIFFNGLFSLALDNTFTENTSNYAYLLSMLFSFETMTHVVKSSRIIAKKFGTARLCIRFVEDIPAFYTLKEFVKQNFMSGRKTKAKRPTNKKVIIIKFFVPFGVIW